MQCGAAKYAEGILTLGEEMISRAFAFDVPRQIINIPLSSPETAATEQSRGGGEMAVLVK
jgi:hypothetical protein